VLEYGYVFAKDLRCSFVFDHLCYVQRHRPMGFRLQCFMASYCLDRIYHDTICRKHSICMSSQAPLNSKVTFEATAITM
jgi:hypothetical protein